MEKDLFSVAGKTAIVTGASSGLGATFAQVLASRGANVVLTARRAGRLQELADQISRDGGTALPICLYCATCGPLNFQLGGKVWSAAASSTVIRRIRLGARS